MQRVEHIMGMPIVVAIRDDRADERVVEKVFDWFRWVDAVKGWSVDGASLILDEAGVGDYAVNAGGDLVLRGRPWRVGIQHPQRREAVARILELTNVAVATSGEYARGRHIVDPHTRSAPKGILSVTVTGPDLATADAYATAAFAMGAERAPHWIARLERYEAMAILADGRVLSTPRFPARGPFTARSQESAVAFAS